MLSYTCIQKLKRCDTCRQKGHFKSSKFCRGNATSRTRGQMIDRSKIGHGRGRGSSRVNYAKEKVDELVDMFEESASTHDVHVCIANLGA